MISGGMSALSVPSCSLSPWSGAQRVRDLQYWLAVAWHWSSEDCGVGEAVDAGLDAGRQFPEVQVGGYEGGQEMVGAVVEDVLELLGDLPLQVL